MRMMRWFFLMAMVLVLASTVSVSTARAQPPMDKPDEKAEGQAKEGKDK